MPYTAPEKRDLYNRATAFVQGRGGTPTRADVIEYLETVNAPQDNASELFLRAVADHAIDSVDLAQRMNARGTYRPRRNTYPALAYQDNRRPEFEYRVVVRSTALNATAATRALVVVTSARALTADEAIQEAYAQIGRLTAADPYIALRDRLSVPQTTTADLVAVFRRIAQ